MYISDICNDTGIILFIGCLILYHVLHSAAQRGVEQMTHLIGRSLLPEWDGQLSKKMCQK